MAYRREAGDDAVVEMVNPALDLLGGVQRREPRALGRLISLIEADDPQADRVEAALSPAGRASVVGLTGSPGAGKSTMASALVQYWRSHRLTVAVLAVDPSSPVTGGALLGDRIRLAGHSLDVGVYIRSMANRGELGGVAQATGRAARVLAGAGFDVVLIETVGVGQNEVAVSTLADTVLVLLTPGMGDAIQAAKSGILEIADILVVNKADRPGAAAAVADLRQMVSLGTFVDWIPEVVQACALAENVDEVVAAIYRHQEFLEQGDRLYQRRLNRIRAELRAAVLARWYEAFARQIDHQLAALAEQVEDGRLALGDAVDQLSAGGQTSYSQVFDR